MEHSNQWGLESMAKLTAKKRNALPSSSFVFPKTRKFPINDRPHAVNAKSRASAKGGAVKAKVDAAVKRKFGFQKGGIMGIPKPMSLKTPAAPKTNLAIKVPTRLSSSAGMKHGGVIADIGKQ